MTYLDRDDETGYLGHTLMASQRAIPDEDWV